MLSAIYEAVRQDRAEDAANAIAAQAKEHSNLASQMALSIWQGDLLNALSLIKENAVLSPLEEFVESFKYVDGYYRVINQRRNSVLTEAFDWLAHPQDTNFLIGLAHLVALKSKPSKKIGILTTARNEGPWFLEWLAYHRTLGADVFCYYNDIDDGSDELLFRLAEHSMLWICENKLQRSISAQQKIFSHALHLNPWVLDYEWICLIDVDEFLLPLDGSSDLESLITGALAKNPDAAAILTNWRWMSDGFRFDWVPGPILDRFPRGLDGPWVKSIIRPRRVTSMRKIHVPTLHQGEFMINSAGEICNSENGSLKAPQNMRMCLLHYYSKSFEEYALKKARGRPSQGVGGAQKNYGDFTWGLIGTQVAKIDEDLRKRTARELEVILKLPGISQIEAATEKLARESLAKLKSHEDLSAMFEVIKTEAAEKWPGTEI